MSFIWVSCVNHNKERFLFLLRCPEEGKRELKVLRTIDVLVFVNYY